MSEQTLKTEIPTSAQVVDPPRPTFRLLDKKIIFPDLESMWHHLNNTFEIKFVATTTKKGHTIYKLKIAPMLPTTEPFLEELFPKDIQYISLVIEHHSIVRDEPSEYDAKGRLHFIPPPDNALTSELMREAEKNLAEAEQKLFAKLINKLNAQLSLDFPSEHKREPYFKELCEYKINLSPFAKFKFEDYVKRDGLTVLDISCGWIIDDFKDETATQGVSLQLSGYKYKIRDELAHYVAQKKRKETIEAKKAENPEEAPRKKRCPNLKVEVEDPPEVIAGRYEILPSLTIDDDEKNEWLKLAKKYGVAPTVASTNL